jgi:hypothetical protein
MAERTFSDEQVMLTLALLSYSGFYRIEHESDDVRTDPIRQSLIRFEHVIGPWDLVWGPGRFRFIGELFDDALMFLVRHKEDHNRFTIVIRGTNPVASRDWLFFDFLATRQMGWSPKGVGSLPSAKISLSTSLGLGALLGMRGPVDMSIFQEGELPFAWDFLEKLLEGGARLVRGTEEAMAKTLHDGLVTVGDMAKDLQRATSSRGVEAAIEALRASIGVLDPLLASVKDVALDLLITTLSREIDRHVGDVGEPRLFDVLGALARSAQEPLEIYITGHSKGGAMAPALALYLADAQGSQNVPDEDRWDPWRRARIHCYTFAGPTPWNESLSDHFDATLGQNSYRIANELDIVTHAWIPQNIREIPNLYGPGLPPPKVLSLLAEALADDVEHLGYRHSGLHAETFRGDLYDRGRSFLAQVVLQHLNAYIDHLELTDEINARDLAGALPSL